MSYARRLSLSATAWLAFSAFGTPASAAFPSLLPNPGFDGSFGGWELWDPSGDGTVTWDPIDAAGELGSGSARVAGGPGQYHLVTCASLPWSIPVQAARATVDVRVLAGRARVRTFTTLGFGGDGPNDGPCSGPAVEDFPMLNFVVAGTAAEFTRHVTEPHRSNAFGMLLIHRVEVMIEEPGTIVLVDNAGVVADTDLGFRDDFERPY